MPDAAAVSCHEVLIIGAGISGIGAAIRLLGAGFRDFVVLEKADALGGTWRDNTYPGCACDVPAALYSYSFAQRSDWSRAFAGQAEILAYVQDVAARHGVLRFIRFRQAVARAQWREAERVWEVETGDRRYRARVLITCAGYLHEPIIPDIPGLSAFPGPVFHSSRWDHELELAGARVAVIGTGASAIQFVPQIQPKLRQLTIYQRTPQWVLPKLDHAIPPIERRLLSLPLALQAWRTALYGGFEALGVGFRRPALLRRLQRIGEAHLRRAVADPELRARLTPDYTLGCKRVLLSNDYYPAVASPNVELLATGLAEVRGRTLIGQDGGAREVDAVILGTGFHVTDPPIAARVFDDAGTSLAERWRDRIEAYRGTTIHGLPNAFMVLGPNLGIGHNSAFIVIEAQLDYIISALETMRARRLARVEVTAEAQARYNEVVQAALVHTVWNTGGCSSYYLDENGHNGVGFPWSTLKMRRLLRRFDAERYALTPADGDAPLGRG